AAREAVAIFDQTGFSKFVFKGRDVVQVLQRLCGNNVEVPLGQAVYTGVFNVRGGIESDLTVIRIAPAEDLIITGSSQPVRDFDWITKNVRPDEKAELVDITRGLSVLGVMGPRSRTLLGRVSDADFSNAAFPFLTSQMIGIGTATVRAVRIT